MNSLRSLCWLAVAASPLLAADVKPELLHGFAAGVPDLSQGVVPGPDGNFYGVSASGGKFGRGTFFRVEPPVSLGSGTVTVLAEFGDPLASAGGAAPAGHLAFDGVGKFYGVTRGGGTSNLGTIFRAALDGTVETLVEFTGFDGAAIGNNPEAGLMLAPDGNFYGTTANGGPVDGGTIFRVSPEGRFKTVVVFTGRRGAFPGSTPLAPLLVLADGTLLGTTFAGGSANLGTIFRLTTNGVFKSVASFTGATGALRAGHPVGHLVQAPSGTVYGLFVGPVEGSPSVNGMWQLPLGGAASRLLKFEMTTNGEFIDSPASGLALLASGDIAVTLQSASNGNFGGIFQVTPAGQVSEVALFDAIAPPILNFFADSGPVADGAGGLVGPIFGSLYWLDAGSTTPELLALPTPDAGTNLGAKPSAQVIFAQDGTLYGYNSEGGGNLTGAVFKRPPAGPLSLLAALPGDFLRDNSQPLAFEEPGSAVLLTQNAGGVEGKGRILQIDSSGLVTDRASFRDSANVADTPARFPKEGLLSDGGGNFYGLATNSGSSFDEEPALYRFSGPLNIVFSVAPLGLGQTFIEGGLALDASGNLVGALPQGGVNQSGVIFRVTPVGVVSTLAEFGGSASPGGSVNPRAPLLPEPGGSFLFFAQPPGNDAITNVLRLTSSSTVETLATLRFEDIAGGFDPVAPLGRDADGRVHAIFANDGLDGGGVLVRIESDGSFQVAHEFRAGAESDAVGFEPSAGLRLGPDGQLYGVTARGGPLGGGALFRIPTTTQAAGDTAAATVVQAGSATLNANLSSNGFGGEYWFTYGEQGGALDQETEHVPFTGFRGVQAIAQVLAGLKGHRTYDFKFHASVGFGSDVVTVTGTMLSFSVPNGKPQPQTDAMLASSIDGPFTSDVLANDTDPDGDTLTIDSFTQGALGAVTQSGDQLIYTPGANFVDRDDFTYTVSDGFGETAMATVNVMISDVVAGEYAGLLFEEEAASAGIPREGAAAITPGQRLAAGFARLALSRRGSFTARFEIGSRSIGVRGRIAAARDTDILNTRAGLTGQIRPLPAGFEGRVTFEGRTLVLVAGQGFFAAGFQRPESAFTVRFTPEDVADPVAGDGLPAGSGFGLIRQGRTARAKLVGVLPDGTPFSKGSTVDPDGLLPFYVQPYKRKTGVVEGTLRLVATGDVEAASDTSWQKPVLLGETRFPAGFTTTLDVFGGQYAPGTPPLDVPTGSQLALAFDRGGLFAPLASRFDVVNGRARPDADNNAARATLNLSPRTGVFSGTFRPEGKAIKFRGAIIQRNDSGAGFFLGRADAGSVLLSVMP